MVSVATFVTMCTLSALAPQRPDTPPPLPIPESALESLRTMEDVINASVLASGARAPANLTLPVLINRRAILEFALAHYPSQLRDTPRSVRAFAWMFVDTRGIVAESRLVRPSGDSLLDALALEVLRVMRFEPALIGRDAVGLWLPYPIQLGSYRQLTEALAQETKPPSDSDPPHFTPYTVPPRLTNRDHVQRALVRLYPPGLRNKHVGGKTVVWAFVDSDGRVTKAIVKTSSGYEQLDDAALEVAYAMQFSSALNGKRPVSVWIQLPIVFSVK
jgi:protein TonB